MFFFILIQQMNYLVHELNVCIKSSEWTLLHVKSADDDCLSADQNEEKSSSNSQKRKKRRHRWDHLRERYSIFITCSQCEKKVWESELCYVFCEFNIPKKRKKRKTVKCNFLTFLNLKMVITYSVWLLYEWKRKTRQDEKKMRKENEK